MFFPLSTRREFIALVSVSVLGLAIRQSVPVYAQTAPPRVSLDRAQRLETRYHGTALRQAAPLSLASGDFDGDGIDDLAAGLAAAGGGAVAIHRGNLDAFAPQSESSFQAISRGEFLSPYLADAQVVAIPSRPDFLAAGDFIGLNGPGIVAAARGGNQLHVVARGKSGAMELLQSITVPGAITGAGAYRLERGKYAQVVVGVHGANGPELHIFSGSNEGLLETSKFSLASDATAFAFGNLDGDTSADVLVVAGKLFILHGASQSLEPVNVPYTVTSAVLGNFVFDRDSLMQMALRASDGSVHILTQDTIDQRPFDKAEINARWNARNAARTQMTPAARERRVNWKEAESYPGAGSAGGAGAAPVMFRSRVTGGQTDDLVLISSSRMTAISHPDGKVSSGIVSDRTDLGSDAVAALSTRVGVSAAPGVVLLKKGDTVPQLYPRFQPPTAFTVNTFSDTVDAVPGDGICADSGGKCSLRAAIMESNTDNNNITITVPAGTYQLTLTGANKETAGETAAYGSLDIFAGMSIVGAVDGSGNPTTIVEAGTSTSNGIDKVFSVNPNGDLSLSTSFSNLVIQFGKNPGSLTGGINIPHGFGGGFFTELNGTGNTTLTNCTVKNNSTVDGDGGGIAVDDLVGGTGLFTLTGSIVSNNTVNEASSGNAGIGGGIWVGSTTAVAINTSKIQSNLANETTTGAPGSGGGIYLTNPSNNNRQSAIHGSVISGNTAGGEGGGIYTGQGILIDSIGASSLIQNNTAAQGGGLWSSVDNDTTTLSKVAITGNSATGTGDPTGLAISGGGGVFSSSNGAANSRLVMHFSRLAGNSSAASNGAGPALGKNLESLGASSSSVAATSNWWGTDAPSGTIYDVNGSVIFDPFIVLTHTANPQVIQIFQFTTLTADMSADNHGNGIGAGNLTQIQGLPVTFDSPILGTILTSQPEQLDANSQASATFIAGSIAGLGSANATVDQAVVAVNSSLISSATETGNTVTISTVGVHRFSAGQYVTVAGVGVSGYNGSYFAITGTPTPTTFTYTDNNTGLAPSSGGTAKTGIIILQPPSISASFSPTTIQTTAGTGTRTSTITFSLTNGNVIPIDASFSDALPSNVGTVPGNLVVASTPGVVNNCGGTVTATAGTGTISFSNNFLPAGTCTIRVNVQSAVDNLYSNSVTIDSTAAGNGNTASGSLTVLAAPQIAKAFSPTSIAIGATSVLTFTLTSNNQNLSLSGTTFTDTLPSGTVVGTPNGLTTTCVATPSAVAGSSTVSISGVSLAPGASCTVSVNILATTVETANNSVTVSDTAAGTGNTANASLTVTPASTTTAVASSVNPSVFGQAVTFTATVTDSSAGSTAQPTGQVQFVVDGSNFGSPVNLAGATGTTSTATSGAIATLTVGGSPHTVSATYSNLDGNFNASSGSLAGGQTVNMANTTTSVGSSSNPSVFGQSVTFTATVLPVSPGGGTPTGSVTFKDGASILGTGTLSSGQASFTTSALTLGGHVITAIYGGDSSFNGSPGTLAGGQTVNKANSVTTVNSSPNPSVFGQSVTFTATVSAASPGAGTPSGTVTFTEGANMLGTGTLSSGQATFTTSALTAGSHTITATYGGDTNFNGSLGTASIAQTVNGANTTTVVGSSVNPSIFGQSVTFTAGVSAAAPGAGTPTGTVTFLDGANPMGTGTLSAGVATFATSALTVGTHTITAIYGSSSNFTASSGTLNGGQVVTRAASSVRLSSSALPATPPALGQPVTLTATVTPAGATGTVTFEDLDSGTALGTGTLSGGTATLTTSALLGGVRSIVAVYGGDSNELASGSATLLQTITSAGSLTFAPAPGSPNTSVGAGPLASVVGDFNGDGKLDLAIANGTSGNVTILLGSGTGAFSQATASPITVGSGPNSIAVGDFNGDGKLDLAVTNGGGTTITVLLGTGTQGGFSAGGTVTVGSNPSSIAVGDFNGDGNLDLAVANSGSDNVTILLGNGLGGFTAAGTVTVGTRPVYIAAGDFNADGKLDLAVANYTSGNVTILQGDGTGGFTAGSPISAGTNPNAIAVADLDGNGTLDLAVANSGSNDVTVLLGNGSLGFNQAAGSPISVGANSQPDSIAVGDFNGDGTLDLVISNFQLGKMTMLLGAGGGAFVQPVSSPFATGLNGRSIVVGDFNGDGKLDVAVPNQGSNNVTILLGTSVGVGTSGTPSTYGTTVTFTATVSPFSSGGTVQFQVDGVNFGTAVTVNAGTATAGGTLPAGTHAVTANYTPAGASGAAIATLSGGQVVNPVSVTPSITASNKPFDGTTTASINCTLSGVLPADVGNVTCSTLPANANFSDANAGNGKTVTATGITLGGTAKGNYALASTTATTTANITAGTTTTAVASSLNPSSYGQSVSFTATVTPAGATGNVQFQVDGVNFGTAVAVSGGTAVSGATTTLPAGSHTVTATLTGTGNYGNSSGTLSGGQTVNVVSVTASVTANNKTFDGTTTATLSGCTLTGSPANLTCSAAAANFSDANVGNGKTVTATGITLGGSAAGNYSLTSTTATTAANIFPAGITTAVSSSLNPSVYGQPVSFTATLTPTAATGSVQFVVDGNNFGSPVTVSGGTATSSASSTLTAGNHAVSANFIGTGSYSNSAGTLSGGQTVTKVSVTPSVTANNKNFDGTNTATLANCALAGVLPVDAGNVSCSAAAATFSDANVGNGKTVTATGITLSGTAAGNYSLSATTATTTANILAAGITTTVSSSLNPSTYGQSVSFTATVTPSAATGSVQFAVDGTNFGSPVTVSGGTASSAATATLAGGSHTVAANFTGTGNYGNSAGTLTGGQTVNKVSVTASVTANNKSYDGTTAATVASCTLAGVLPADVGNVTCSAAGATFSDPNAGNGKTVTATGITLSGSAASNYALSSTTATTTANILVAGGITTTVSSSANPSTYGQSVSFTATINPAAATGTVQFVVDGSNFGSPVTVSGGTATSVATSTLPAGSHTVSANFTGSGSYGNSAGTLAGGQTVNKVTVTASVTANNKTFDGTATATIATCTLSGVLPADVGNVTCSAAAATFSDPNAGNGKTVTATGITLGGSAASNYALSSTTATTTANILIASGITTVVTSSINPSTYGQAVTFTASLTPTAATGTVQFVVDGSNFGSPVTVSGGTATSGATSTLSPGSHTVAANFTGSGSYGNSTGTLAGGQTVNKATVTASVTANNKTYDGTTAATIASCTVTGALPADAANVTCSAAAATFSDANAATGKTVTATGITLNGSAAGNYTLSSTSAATTANISPATTATVLASSANPSAVGQPVIFTATVTPAAAAGTVQFVVDGVNVGSPVTVSGGTAASAPISTLAGGLHVVTATFTGNGNFGNSSATLTGSQNVTAGGAAVLFGTIAGKAGPQNARVWTFTIGNSGGGLAAAVQISSIALTQTSLGSGQPCTPVVTSPPAFPLQLGNLAAGAFTQGSITINFTGCANAAEFSAVVQLAANNGASTASIVRHNEER